MDGLKTGNNHLKVIDMTEAELTFGFFLISVCSPHTSAKIPAQPFTDHIVMEKLLKFP